MLTGLALAIKIALYVGALVCVGLASHNVFGITRSLRGTRTAVFILLAACAGRLLVSSAQLAGSLSGAYSGEMLSWVWQSLGNQMIAFAMGAMILLLATLKPHKSIFIAGLSLIAIGFGLSGHVQGLESPGLLPILVALHLFIAGFWVAAPLTLAPYKHNDDQGLIAATSRFSQIAIYLVPLVFVSGIVLLWKLAGGVSGITGSSYGRLLGAKLVFALILLAIGAYNKQKVSALLRDNPVVGRATLALTLRLETSLFIAIVVIVTLATTILGPS